MREQDYIRGSRSAYRFMMLHCMRELDVETDAEKLEQKVAQLAAEREEAIGVLRDICRDCGDNDWSDDLHLADIIEKHLGRHLDRQRRTQRTRAAEPD